MPQGWHVVTTAEKEQPNPPSAYLQATAHRWVACSVPLRLSQQGLPCSALCGGGPGRVGWRTPSGASRVGQNMLPICCSSVISAQASTYVTRAPAAVPWACGAH